GPLLQRRRGSSCGGSPLSSSGGEGRGEEAVFSQEEIRRKRMGFERPARDHMALPFCVRFRLSAGAHFNIISAMFQTQNLHVKETVRLITPRALKAELPASEVSNRTVFSSREAVMRILGRQDPRLLVVVGPCSIHDVKGALDYGRKLNGLRRELAEQMEIVMRVYFEKPRTTTGWKGLINDPHL